MSSGRGGPFVSIVVCTCSPDNYPNLTAAVDSLLEQNYREKEILIVVDGNPDLYRRVEYSYGRQANIRSFLLPQNSGVSAARNAGIRAARGEIIAFIDDDAVAARDWLEQLLNTYREFGALAAGGKILPAWIRRAPDFLPEELYWLVGATHDGFAADKVMEIRNVFGPNMSFKSEVFRSIGLFNPHFGFSGKSKMQAEEPELAIRMQLKYGKGVLYNPRAIVHHKIPPAKTKAGILLKRAFFQGYSKAVLNRQFASAGAMASEKSYLGYLLFRCFPRRASKLYRLAELKKTVFLLAAVSSVGLGFICGYLKR